VRKQSPYYIVQLDSRVAETQDEGHVVMLVVQSIKPFLIWQKKLIVCLSYGQQSIATV